MIISKQFISCLAALVFGLCATGASAQAVRVDAKLDSMAIFIGGQVGLNISVLANPAEEIHVLPLPDSLSANVEVVEALRPDTTMEGALRRYTQRYLITSFDSGLHYVPPITVVVRADSSTVQTPEFALNVVNPFQDIKMDEQSGIAKIFDVHSAQDAPFQWRELLRYWPWLVGVIVLAALIIAIVWAMRKYGNRGGGEVKKVVPTEPCEVTAMRELERIRTEKLWQSNRTKDYYSELTDTLRRYVSARYTVSAMESTTPELLQMLAPLFRDSKEDLKLVESILEQADFVKFAKMEPAPDDNIRAVADAILFVDHTTARVQPEAESIAETAAPAEAAEA